MLFWDDYLKGREEFGNILSNVKKASGLVENLNDRIRDCMDMKRVVPTNYFALMKVYFNMYPYRRSRIKNRVGKSPLELLTGTEQPDFFEALGY